MVGRSVRFDPVSTAERSMRGLVLERVLEIARLCSAFLDRFGLGGALLGALVLGLDPVFGDLARLFGETAPGGFGAQRAIADIVQLRGLGFGGGFLGAGVIEFEGLAHRVGLLGGMGGGVGRTSVSAARPAAGWAANMPRAAPADADA
ncbi:MAG: hypothetical protein KKG32_07355, partial [Alphaproteobacteria bacterium]|nr:hypothetical protein [Alphaproteobacteria bacterium]